MNSDMECNEAGLNLIKSFESCRLEAYQDQRGIWTIGWGHTGAEVIEGLTCTQDEASHWLAHDLKTAETAIKKDVNVLLNENQFSSLCSFVFNIGQGNFKKSTLLSLLNQSLYGEVPTELLRWDKNHDGSVNTGLLRRRIAEKQLWQTVPPQTQSENAVA